MLGIRIDYAGNMQGRYLVYDGIHIEHARNTLGICLEYAMNMLGLCRECAWNMRGIRIDDPWNMHEYAWNM